MPIKIEASALVETSRARWYFDWSNRLVDHLMAREVQASEAKTHFARLLDEVERGETIIITRHGQAIARIGRLAVKVP